MSSTETFPSGTIADATRGPATDAVSWRACLIAIGITGLLALAGQSFANGASDFATVLLKDVNPAFIRVAIPAISSAYQLLLVWLLLGWLYGARRRTLLALAWPDLKVWQWAAALVGVYAVKAVVSIAVVAFIQAIGADPAARVAGGALEAVAPLGAIMRSPMWPLLLSAGILAAVAEELIYRGYLSQTLEGSRLGFWGGATLAAVIWAALHLYYPFGIQVVLVIVGLSLSWLRARTGSIYPGMLWHIANNAVALIVLKMIG